MKSLKQIKNALLAEYIEELERTVEELAAKLSMFQQLVPEQPDDLAERLGVKGVRPRNH
jgi:hypothetical protein